MPQRMSGLFLALAGVVAVVGLVLVGVNVRQSAATGPLWKRRLVTAGLFLLAAVGLAGCNPTPSSPTAGASTTGAAAKGEELSARPEWRELIATWKDAAPIATHEDYENNQPYYPFDKAGQKRLLGRLAKATLDVEVLTKANLLSESETWLLKDNLADLTYGVEMKRPTELKNATCYMPMASQRQNSFVRLTAQLPMLRQMAAGGKVHPEVINTLLPGVEADARELTKDIEHNWLTPEQRAKAPELQRQAAEQIAAIRNLAAPASEKGK